MVHVGASAGMWDAPQEPAKGLAKHSQCHLWRGFIHGLMRFRGCIRNVFTVFVERSTGDSAHEVLWVAITNQREWFP